jgi:hypothetical protein
MQHSLALQLNTLSGAKFNMFGVPEDLNDQAFQNVAQFSNIGVVFEA